MSPAPIDLFAAGESRGGTAIDSPSIVAEPQIRATDGENFPVPVDVGPYATSQ